VYNLWGLTFSLSVIPWKLTQDAVSINSTFPFKLMKSITEEVCTTAHSAIHLLKKNWALSGFSLLWIKLLMSIHVGVFVWT
jgi:hypothetical protein